MKAPTRASEASRLAALVLEATRKTTPNGRRPSEEAIVAWAEGRLEVDDAKRVLHWIAHDPWSHSCYLSYLEYADDEYESATVPQSATTLQESKPALRRESPSTRLRALWNRWLTLPIAATALATLVALFVVAPQLLSPGAPLGLDDYARWVSDPAENWRYPTAQNASGRSVRDRSPSAERRALLFGVRSALLDLGIGRRAAVETFYDALPVAYPICENHDEACERLHQLLYQLGRWAVLTERACNTSLRLTDREKVLSSQASALVALTANSVAFDGEMSALLADARSRDGLCRVADALYRWSLA